MATIISISNHKGGVGKTTSSLNIGAGLQQLGKKVLLVDLDPQANLTTSVGIQQGDRTIYDYLVKKNLQSYILSFKTIILRKIKTRPILI